MNNRLTSILVGLLFALLSVYAGLNSYFFISDKVTSGFPGWYVSRDGRVRTTKFGANPTIPLQDGDRIETLNGEPFRSNSQYLKTFGPTVPGTIYTVAILRDGRSYEFTLQTMPQPRLLKILNVLIQMRPLMFVWLVAGLIIFLLQTANKQALLLSLMFGMMAVGGDPSPNLLVGGLPAWLLGLTAPAHVAAALAPVVLFHFFLVFPERSILLRRFPRMEYSIYLVWLLLAAPFVLLRAYFWITATERFVNAPQEFPLLSQLSNGLLSISVVGGLVCLVVSYRQTSQSARRKIRVVVTGTVIGLAPFTLFKLLGFYWGNPAINNLTTAACIGAILMLVVAPLSFAYAIARHRVIPVSLIIRRSVQYLLAKNALRLLLMIPVVGVIATVVGHPERSIGEVLYRNSVYFYGLVTMAVALGLVFRGRLSQWIDRKFFRESYNQEKILRELIDEVRKAQSLTETSALVCQKIEASLHPEHAYLFYRQGERRDLLLGYSTGGSADGLSVPEEARLLQFMEAEDKTQDFPFSPRNKLPEKENDWLAGLGTRLIVPLTGTDGRLAGLLLLAQKRSEIPYTARDRELLEMLAHEIAFVYENARLRQRVDRDQRIKQEVLARIDAEHFNLLKECPRCGACYDSNTELCVNDQTELAPSLPVERTIENRYRLERLIGRGGMGAVYEATDARLNRRVAIKILKGSMFGDRTALRRFAREAQVCARLSHPNIIAIHDYGVLSTEGAFLVMDLAGGETLRARIKREHFIQPSVAADIFNQTLEGLKAAHTAGVVHRDLKPENILISDSGDGLAHVRILDFGLAKLTQAVLANSQSPTVAAPLTTPGVAVGTFGYMSPEQLLGDEVDERSDLFSLGVVVVEAVTGRRPFGGTTYHELVTDILNRVYHLPQCSLASERLDLVLQRCLAKERMARFNSAAELQSELIPALEQCPFLAAEVAATFEADTFILSRLNRGLP